ncbi:MAG: hypothetical protein GY754_02465 [bacterium]|nr:hypothetical protein [bacterium]
MFETVYSITTKMIDLYDNTEFESKDLLILKNELNQELQKVYKKKEEKWDFVIAYKGVTNTPIYKELSKTELVNLIKKFIFIIELAIKRNEKILCLGD